MDENNFVGQLTLLLAVLAAFFTLITGALAVGVSMAWVYFNKLKKDRESEVEELVKLQEKFEQKIAEIGDKAIEGEELERLKKEFNALRNSYVHAVYPIPRFTREPLRNGPTNVELKEMINDLLAQIASLQKQLGKNESNDKNG